VVDLGQRLVPPDLVALHPRGGLDRHQIQRGEHRLRDVDRVGGEPLQHLADAVGVERGVGGVARRHDLEERPPLFAADLAHHDVVGALSERRLQQVELVDIAPVVVAERRPGDRRDPVPLWELDLSGVLDRDDLRIGGDEKRHRVQRGGLPRRRPAREDQALVVFDTEPQKRHLLEREGLPVDQVHRRERDVFELSDSVVGAVIRHLPAERQLRTRPVGEGGVNLGPPFGDALARPLGEFDHEIVEFVLAV